MSQPAPFTRQHPTAESIVRALLWWFAASARDLPWRRTLDPYAIWVSEVMLQQTRTTVALPYWRRWMRALPTVWALARARPAKLRKLWEGLGYYSRVQNLHRAARHIVRHYEGRFPEDVATLLSLPGVGPYTAGAIASIAFNQPQPILDGNVVRVLSRLFAIQANPRQRQTRARLWELARALVTEAARLTSPPAIRPRRSARHQAVASGFPPRTSGPCSALNQSLMELGAVVCTSRRPRCQVCPLAGFCAAHRLGLSERLPRAERRTPLQTRWLAAFIVRQHGKYLVRQRPKGTVNARFWELPQVNLPGPDTNPARYSRSALGIVPRTGKPLLALTHHITRYRWRVKVFEGDLVRPLPGARWFTPAQLRRAAFTTMGRKILTHWQGT